MYIPAGEYSVQIYAPGAVDEEENELGFAYWTGFNTVLMCDFNQDGVVDFDDLLAVAQAYGETTGQTWANGDANYDGAVDFADLLLIAQSYGNQQEWEEFLERLLDP